MKSIIHIVGNRPQFVKLAVLHQELAQSGLFSQKIVHTGQHFSYDMSELFFKELNIPPADINFDINNLSAAGFIGAAADRLEQYFINAGHCIVFVYGDTNTTVAAAMAAKRANRLLVHFEAGVRTGDNAMPEEINRIITDRLADINLCCTARNFAAMQAEGYGTSIKSGVYLTGDLMLDAFNRLGNTTDKIVPEKKYVACTIHRSANISDGNNLHQITGALNKINATLPVILPLHPNTKKMMEKFGCRPAFKTLDPLGYSAMKSLLSGAEFVITDSGGTCRESYFLKKPTLIIMDKPFWPEVIAHNCALSTGAAKEAIVNKFYALADLRGDFSTAIFGDGNAAAAIRTVLQEI